MTAIFGCVVPGELPIVDFNQVDESRWQCPIGAAAEMFVVFLTGAEALPDGFGLTIYLAREDSMDFEYIGSLTNARPSATFKTPVSFLDVISGTSMMLGLCLESLEEIRNLGETASQTQAQFRAATQLEIARRVGDDLYNFVCSFSRMMPMGDEGGHVEEVVCLPTSWVDKWKERIDAKMAKDSTFWGATAAAGEMGNDGCGGAW